MALTHLFSPLKVGSVEIRNRIFSTGHQTVLVGDGAPNVALIAYQEARARGGGGGLVVASMGHQRNASLEAALAGYPGEVHPIGDCLSLRTVEEAVVEALEVATAI